MPKITKSITGCYSIHEDGWTETLEGLQFLISQIENLESKNDKFNSTLMLRLVFISASYLAEQIFVQTVNRYISGKIDNLDESQKFEKRVFEDFRNRMSVKKVGISKAMEEWPKVLVGQKMKFGEGSLQSLKEVINKRNDIIHKLNYSTECASPSTISHQIYYTTIEACQEISEHFFPGEKFKYEEWLKKYVCKANNYYEKI